MKKTCGGTMLESNNREDEKFSVQNLIIKNLLQNLTGRENLNRKVTGRYFFYSKSDTL